MLRHNKQQTTARYIHAVNGKQIEAQGKYLDAIKIVVKHPDRAAQTDLGLDFGLETDRGNHSLLVTG